ncbi:MAG: DUF3095 domain-containing protein [Pseudomonadota bacterium]
MTQTSRFYEELPRETDFSLLTNDSVYHAVPSGWLIGVADIKGSTALVESGQYKTVNLVGAAVISAMMNAVEHAPFPFVFGGDGASFAIQPDFEVTARQAMSAVARWADAEFGIEMRVALVPMSDVRMAGADVRVARFAVSSEADYAMFAGGGLLWAENQMKDGAFALAKAPPGTIPDLTGLSCRWANMKATQGTILSLVIAPRSGANPGDIEEVLRKVIRIADGLSRGGHPSPDTGMEARWAAKSARLEGHAARGHGSLFVASLRAGFESAFYWVLFKLRIVLAGFDPHHYARTVAANADFRKLDDGLKMTLDCDPETLAALERTLADAQTRGFIRYGMVTQNEAMMTCIVPSPMTDDHLHFVDGAKGGYTSAATKIKSL